MQITGGGDFTLQVSNGAGNRSAFLVKIRQNPICRLASVQNMLRSTTNLAQETSQNDSADTSITRLIFYRPKTLVQTGRRHV